MSPINTVCRAGRFAVAALVGVGLSAAVFAQFQDRNQPASVYLEPGAVRKRTRPPARLSFTLVDEIALPGPLQAGGARLAGERIEIPVAQGWVTTSWSAGAVPVVRDRPAAPDAVETEAEWSVGPAGKYRFRALPTNRIVAEKRCRRCRRGWRQIWKLRIAGQTLAPPLVTDRRVFFGALDNRVYSVRKRNGHRVWATDVGGRVLGGLVLWSATETAAPSKDRTESSPAAILVVPGRGRRILALDPRSGTEVASFTLPDPESKLVGEPVSTPDGRIVAAAQKYAPTDASLMVLRLDPVSPPPDESPPVLYNDSTASGPAPAR